MGPMHRFAKLLTGTWSRPRGVAMLAASALAVCLPAPAATAQIQRIDEATARSVTLSGSQRDEVDRFVSTYAPLVFGDDPAESARGLEELLTPLRDPGVSVAFRQALAELLRQQIAEAIADDRVVISDADGNETVNAAPYSAMRLAGELATQNTVGLIEAELDADNDGRRFFAIYATESVFYAAANAAPAVTPGALYNQRGDRSTGLIAVLGDRLEAEPSARHAAAIVRSLTEASTIREEQFADAASAALARIGNGASARARASRGEEVTTEERLVWLTAGQSMFRAIAQSGGRGSDREAGLASIRLAGHLVASVYEDLEAERLPPVDERGGESAVVPRQMLQLARNLLTFGDQAHASASGRAPNRELEAAALALEDAFLGKGSENLRRVSLSLVSGSGLLTAAPYGFSDDEFIGN